MSTPLIKIKYRYENKEKYIYTKLEYYNITGSIKDRMASYIILKAKERGELKEGMPIIEATSGNTGIAISALGARYDHPVYIFMTDWASIERKKIMEMYNANIILYSKEEGGFNRCIVEAKRLSQKINGFLVNQFENMDNVLAHYETTGIEIINDMPEKIGGFISGVGTGGTLMGTAKRLKEVSSNIKIGALEPEKMPILSRGGVGEQHLIEGIGNSFIPKIVDTNLIDEVILVNDRDAINMARLLSRKFGIGVGISSGANFIAGVVFKENIRDAVVTVFPDDNKKYISTELSNELEYNDEFISNKIELLYYEII